MFLLPNHKTELLSGPSLAHFKFVFIPVCQKHYGKIRVSADFFKKKGDAQFLNVTNWAKLVFFLAANLAQLVMFKNGHFSFFVFKIVLKLAPQTTITFHILQNTG